MAKIKGQYNKYLISTLLDVLWLLSTVLLTFVLIPSLIAAAIPDWSIVAYLLLASAIVFGVYAKDKRLSKQGTERISERQLLLVSACSLHIPTLFCMQIVKHKTAKLSFLLKLLMLLLFQVVGLVSMLIGLYM
ncbi:hypothetical protein CWB99_13755 [Pseudoalteromonas rubra]|uniref:DUF1294 domain-containing protein n=1 Tax=Pseudoalteromonas rubra TaxID=43658 RepID=A0A5S3WK33_9GAMM|nr:DUF1294 domain-containing protein [Pseudoalteromonas rubra]TMP27752.1 hypothetical protein CWB99_13755 [Pseudoalteromonas rubra]TMP32480.1 hypothetical protein CWC00_12405 [Pseudoalteromonas rubra]